jgi:hypothetical protein
MKTTMLGIESPEKGTDSYTETEGYANASKQRPGEAQ